MLTGKAQEVYDALTDKFDFTEWELICFCRSIGIKKVPWKGLMPYRNLEKATIHFPPKKGTPSVKKEQKVQGPVTDVNLGSLLETEADVEEEVKEEQERPIVEKQPDVSVVSGKDGREYDKHGSRDYPLPTNDPSYATKYEDEVQDVHKKGVFTGASKLYVVQDFNDGFIVGISKSFDTVFDVILKRALGGYPDFANKEVAKKKVEKDGYIIIKANSCNLKAMIKTMALE